LWSHCYPQSSLLLYIRHCPIRLHLTKHEFKDKIVQGFPKKSKLIKNASADTNRSQAQGVGSFWGDMTRGWSKETCSGRFQVLLSLKERTGQRHRGQSCSRVLPKGKEKCRHRKRKSGGLWPGYAEALVFVQRAIYTL
jgi:hypothetical protein